MDISELMTQDAHEEGVEVEIFHPSEREEVDGKRQKKSLGVFFTVLGVDSKAYQIAVKKAVNSQISRFKDTGALSEGATIDLEIAQIAAVIIGWRGIESGETEVPYSSQKCLELMTKSPWMRAQIDEFIGERKNFTKG
jgi:hypothetical protein